MDYTAAGKETLSEVRFAPRALCGALSGRGNQFVVLPSASRRYLRQVGGKRAGVVSFLRQNSENHHARAPAVQDERAAGAFISDVTALGGKLGALLVQLPPSLAFEPRVPKSFFALLRRMYAGTVLLEPRHATWFTADAGKLLATFRIGRVAADPAPVPAAAKPGGSPNSVYFRLHGSPRMYYSSYTDKYLDAMAGHLTDSARKGRASWCIFDNTAFGVATGNAFSLLRKLGKAGKGDQK